MTTIRQLYDIQEVDLEIAQCHSLILSIDGQLGDRVALDATHRGLETQRARGHELRLQRRTRELDAESIREKVQ